jgi:hypothetical protein
MNEQQLNDDQQQELSEFELSAIAGGSTAAQINDLIAQYPFLRPSQAFKILQGQATVDQFMPRTPEVNPEGVPISTQPGTPTPTQNFGSFSVASSSSVGTGSGTL